MPYPHSLERFYRPEFDRPAPESWVTRLREISPVTERMSHLIFRWREPQEWWFDPEHGMWELYAATPRAMVDAERAEQFRQHWSELPPSRQEGRHAFVTNYQHYQWHSRGVDVKRFWVLQGEWGGTAAMYSHREKRAIDAEPGGISEPFPLGMFAPCPFDERAVKAVSARDRFFRAGSNLDALMKLDSAAAVKAEYDLSEQQFRATFTKHFRETIRPQADYIAWICRTKEGARLLRRATKEETDLSATYADTYTETGTMPGALSISQRARSVAVPGAISA